ncbi:MAG: PKD domain-containing protein, partial [Flavobacteriales bacterium]
ADRAQWSTTGTGQFIATGDSLDPIYAPSPNDIDSGEVTFTLETFGGSALCGDDIDSLKISIYPSPVAGFTTDPVCANETSSLMDTSQVENDSITSWQWIVSNDTLMAEDTSYTFSNSGSIDISHTVTTSNGCSDSVLKSFSIDPTPNADFGYELNCDGEVAFTDSSTISSGTIAGWDWKFGDSDSSDVQDPVHEYSDSGKFVVDLTAISDSGCSDMMTDTVIVPGELLAEYTPKGGEFNVGDVIEFNNQSANNMTNVWNFGDGNSSSSEDTLHSYAEAGKYPVTLIVKDSIGCRDTVMYEFNIRGEGINPVRVPNAFSPNGDGVNDELNVLGGPFKKIDFRVFNEWGEQIFRTTDQEKGWNGKIDGKAQPNGRYIYTVKGITVDGNEVDMKGEVNLIK